MMMTSSELAYIGFWATVCNTLRPMPWDCCLSPVWLSVTLVYCGQTVGWIKMKLSMEVGFGPGPSARWGTQLTLPKKGQSTPPLFGHVYCGQTAGWIKMSLGTEVGLGPGHIMLDGDPAPPKRGHSPPISCSCLLWPNGWMDQEAT